MWFGEVNRSDECHICFRFYRLSFSMNNQHSPAQSNARFVPLVTSPLSLCRSSYQEGLIKPRASSSAVSRTPIPASSLSQRFYTEVPQRRSPPRSIHSPSPRLKWYRRVSPSLSIFFSSHELKARVSFSDRLSVCKLLTFSSYFSCHQYNRDKFNQTWHKASLGERDWYGTCNNDTWGRGSYCRAWPCKTFSENALFL